MATQLCAKAVKSKAGNQSMKAKWHACKTAVIIIVIIIKMPRHATKKKAYPTQIKSMQNGFAEGGASAKD